MITIHRISHRIYRYLGIVGIHIAGSLSTLGSDGGVAMVMRMVQVVVLLHKSNV